ncbi:formimidoylglutamase [Aurantibacter aestuarii]|uniref:Arginase n=1 Tax=Aurantibacter aestuarii TaxID=1266046 RepID=A0A2T1N865_9FLAO|nr:formimidoylglutamase [Aurantibacter aestuarii]PSG88070.1 arginase [Aurantibacter aestuarii]
MKNFILFTETHLKSILKPRLYETKFGEHIHLLSNITNINAQISKSDVKYVLIGINESIGINANLGYSKAYNAFNACIKVLLNTQSNHFIDPKTVLLLGSFEYPDFQKELKKLDLSTKKDLKKARQMVSMIDTDISKLVHDIVKAGKIPIVVGGGHNNAYGCIKGSSLALKNPINAVNFDAHTDFRPLEGRHSGNGFSYAMDEGFLKNYFIFGLHENYTSKAIFDSIEAQPTIAFNTFEDLRVRRRLKFKKELKRAKQFICNTPFGLEIDCDAIENINSSAKTPSGFSVEKTRQFISYFAKQKQVSYFHLCEASCSKKDETQVGKLLSFFITDFIKAQND